MSDKALKKATKLLGCQKAFCAHCDLDVNGAMHYDTTAAKCSEDVRNLSGLTTSLQINS